MQDSSCILKKRIEQSCGKAKPGTLNGFDDVDLNLTLTQLFL